MSTETADAVFKFLVLALLVGGWVFLKLERLAARNHQARWRAMPWFGRWSRSTATGILVVAFGLPSVVLLLTGRATRFGSPLIVLLGGISGVFAAKLLELNMRRANEGGMQTRRRYRRQQRRQHGRSSRSAP